MIAPALTRARSAISVHTRLVDDFPLPGVRFKDLTPVLADPEGLDAVIAAMAEACVGADYIAGIDARGFLLGGAIARELGIGVVAVRKAGKLPPPVIGIDYQLEYGSARLEMPASGIDFAGRSVAIVDDVLATGGTLRAAADLVTAAGARVCGLAVIMELTGLGGREFVTAGRGETLVIHTLCDG